MYKYPFRPRFVGLKKSSVPSSFCCYSVHDAQCPEVFQAIVLNIGRYGYAYEHSDVLVLSDDI